MRTAYCTFYLVRHGETDWDVKKLISSQKNISLNKKGIEKTQNLAFKFRKINFDTIYTSDLFSSLQTAKIINGRRTIPIIKSKALRERDYARYTGQSYENFGVMSNLVKEIKEKKKTKLKVETDNEVLLRFRRYIRKICLENLGKTILVVSHAGPIKLYLIYISFRTLENLTENGVKNLSYVKIIEDTTSVKIISTNGIRRLVD